MYETECDKKTHKVAFFIRYRGSEKRRRALKKTRRALITNTAGFEKKAAGFKNKDGRVSESSMTGLEMSRESLKKIR